MTTGGWVRHEFEIGARKADELLTDLREAVHALEVAIERGATNAEAWLAPGSVLRISAEHPEVPKEPAGPQSTGPAADSVPPGPSA
jgi:hypothetical protein